MAILGIDLGTTNSLACVWQQENCVLVPNAFGNYLTPSVVSFLENGEVLVGEAAKQRLLTHPSSTFAQFKRFMGTDKTWQVYGKCYQAQDFSAFVIRKLIADAEAFLKEEISEVLISVPAYFNDDQRWATRIAGELAGVKSERIINEPSAAALAQHLECLEEDVVSLVVDFGGGTLDISLVEAFDNIVEIRAISGDNHLGGCDFDEALTTAFLQEHNLTEASLSLQERHAIQKEMEAAKRRLSEQTETTATISLRGITYAMELTRGKMTAICMPLLQRIRTPLQRVLKDAQISAEQLDDVILAGGSCQMPMVIQFLEYCLQRDVKLAAQPDLLIAQGCGIACGIKERQTDIRDVVLCDICPFTLGVEVYDSASDSYLMGPVIERNTSLPCSKEHLFAYQLHKGKLKINILQGEHRKAAENHVLKTIKVSVPKAEKDQPLFVRFTYDINSILEVEIKTETTNTAIVVRNKLNRMNEADIQQRLKELKEYKLINQQKEVYRLLLERGERLYYESIGEKRALLAACLQEFESALKSEDTNRIHSCYRKAKQLLDSMEGGCSYLS